MGEWDGVENHHNSDGFDDDPCHVSGETPSETVSPNQGHHDNTFDSFLKCMNAHLQNFSVII